uniref:Uncharacterized protein n=1 Tax=Opuntia streptacantha TaxID=393608 RepID=A0A7C8YMU8_OPUST
MFYPSFCAIFIFFIIYSNGVESQMPVTSKQCNMKITGTSLCGDDSLLTGETAQDACKRVLTSAGIAKQNIAKACNVVNNSIETYCSVIKLYCDTGLNAGK